MKHHNCYLDYLFIFLNLTFKKTCSSIFNFFRLNALKNLAPTDHNQILSNFPQSSVEKTQEIEYVHYSELAMRALIMFYKQNILLHFLTFLWVAPSRRQWKVGVDNEKALDLNNSTVSYTKVINVGSDTFGNPIFQKG